VISWFQAFAFIFPNWCGYALVVNAKKAQNEEDRLTEIEHQNRLLLHNLSKIAERKVGGGAVTRVVSNPVDPTSTERARGEAL
jgi:hypothetical protein